MAMNLGELRDFIEEIETQLNMIRDNDDDSDEPTLYDIEVRLATQPNWPFETSVVSAPEVNEDTIKILNGRQARQYGWAVYLGEGEQLGYLPGDVKRDVWGE